MYVRPVEVLSPKAQPFYGTSAEIKPKTRAPVLLPFNTEQLSGHAYFTAKDPDDRSLALIELESLLLDVWDEAGFHLAAKCSSRSHEA
jgi:hypothetical protein